MLEKLTYSVTFPSTGRAFAGDLDFKTGFGTITGPNEAGKSLIIEIARWCLFGTAALRGKADDYKTLKATLRFRVRGEAFTVERSSSTCKLTKDDKVLATGTKPVNAHICQLLGFGLEVFDVACVANQGDVEKLSAMKPTERKRMVDEVVGLNRLEDLAKWCGDEARVLERQQVPPGDEPVEPAEPMGDIEAARAAFEEMHEIRGVLTVVQEPPVAPTCPGTQTVAELQPLVEAEREARAEFNMLKTRLASLPEAFGYNDAELTAFEALWDGFEHWQARERFEKLHPRSSQTREALLAMQGDWAVIDQRDSLVALWPIWRSTARWTARTASITSSWRTTGSRACGPSWRPWATSSPLLSPSPRSRSRWTRPDDWDLKDTQDDWELVKDAVETHRPRITRFDIDIYRRANVAAIERKEIELRLSQIPPSCGIEAKLQARLTYESNLARHQIDLVNYDTWQKKHAQAQARVHEIKPLAEQFSKLGGLQIEWHRYNDRKEIFDAASAEYNRLSVEADGWRRAQTALNNLRVMVKGHLVPALSKVASHLLAQMTGGQRNIVSVDQEFNVVVDGQPLDTLSGSGKAVANLALRLGLGQVLTNNVSRSSSETRLTPRWTTQGQEI